MYLTLIYRDQFVREDFPKKQFYPISKDLKACEIESLVKYWKMNPFIENLYVSINQDKHYEKTNNSSE